MTKNNNTLLALTAFSIVLNIVVFNYFSIALFIFSIFLWWDYTKKYKAIKNLKIQIVPEYRTAFKKEAFYLATKAPAKFFGNSESFEIGKSFNALIIDDEYYDLNLIERLSKFIYNGDDRNIVERYLDSKIIKI